MSELERLRAAAEAVLPEVMEGATVAVGIERWARLRAAIDAAAALGAPAQPSREERRLREALLAVFDQAEDRPAIRGIAREALDR